MKDKIKKILHKIKKIIKKPVVALVPINGAIGVGGYGKKSINFENLNQRLEEAFKTAKVKMVVLSINSPGGSPVQSELIYKRVRMLSEIHKIPVVTYAEDIAASGGYYIMLAGDELYSAENSIIGSIGVITHGFGFDQLIKHHKIERRVISQGKNKSILDPFQPLKDSDVTMLKNMQKDVYDNFVELVRSRRGNKLNDGEEIFDGSVWSAKSAREIGLIDGVSTVHEIVKDRFGKDAEIRIFGDKKSAIARMLGASITIGIENIFAEIVNYFEAKFITKMRIDY